MDGTRARWLQAGGDRNGGHRGGRQAPRTSCEDVQAAPRGRYLRAIITAAILDAAGGTIPTDALVVAVVATLVVYWLGEEYADLLGEQVEGGVIPSWAHIREELAATLPMVSASYLPLLMLVLARVAGASPLAAANVGLITAAVLLTFHAWSAGRSAKLHGWQLLFAISIAAGLGLAMIALKDVVITHLH